MMNDELLLQLLNFLMMTVFVCKNVGPSSIITNQVYDDWIVDDFGSIHQSDG